MVTNSKSRRENFSTPVNQARQAGCITQINGDWERLDVEGDCGISDLRGDRMSELCNVIREELKDKLRHSRLAPVLVDQGRDT